MELVAHFQLIGTLFVGACELLPPVGVVIVGVGIAVVVVAL